MRPDLLDLEAEGQIVLPAKQTAYAEGQYIFKRKGITYFLYTQGGGENYRYAYMMSRTGIKGPWIAPENDIIAISDEQKKSTARGMAASSIPRARTSGISSIWNTGAAARTARSTPIR